MNSSGENIKVAIDTLGCKLNQAETENVARHLARAGYLLVPSSGPSDVYILNSCSVTHIADRKSRHLLRMAHRRNPDSLVIVTGCYARHSPGELSEIEGVGLVLTTGQITDLPGLLAESGYPVSSSTAHRDMDHPDIFRTRAFIKAQEGCNNYCTYCIVPLVRGRARSLPAGQVIDDIKLRVADGYKEIVITGTEIGSYRDNDTALMGLLFRILAETGVRRLRLTSLQPQEVSLELLKLWQDPVLCRHFHLSLQSGSDAVLQRMKRCYTVAGYLKAVELVRSIIPGAAVTTDIIVGFPGETEKEFAESYQLCRRLGFSRVHVFPYSPRRGTAAADLPDQVSPATKKARTDKMLALSEQSALEFRQKLIGQTLTILFEKKDGGFWTGLTDNYVKVYLQSDKDLTNQVIPVKVTDIEAGGVSGKELNIA